MVLLPLIETVLKLIIVSVEGVHPKQRMATSIALFWISWPLLSRLIKRKEDREQVEQMVRSIRVEVDDVKEWANVVVGTVAGTGTGTGTGTGNGK